MRRRSAVETRARRLVAGCTDLGVESNLRRKRWPHLVSVEAVRELHEFADTDVSVRIGAAMPLSEIEARWHHAPVVVREWLTLFASPPIRNRATLGGNLATASPIGDAAPLLLALDAAVHLAGPRRPAHDSAGIVLHGLPADSARSGRDPHGRGDSKAATRRVRFYKVAKRRLDDISTVAAAMAIDRESSGRVRRARFAFGGVAASPVRVREAEEAVVGQLWNESSIDRVQRVLDRTLTPLGDHRGSREYRREVSKSLVEKFWMESRA